MPDEATVPSTTMNPCLFANGGIAVGLAIGAGAIVATILVCVGLIWGGIRYAKWLWGKPPEQAVADDDPRVFHRTQK